MMFHRRSTASKRSGELQKRWVAVKQKPCEGSEASVGQKRWDWRQSTHMNERSEAEEIAVHRSSEAVGAAWRLQSRRGGSASTPTRTGCAPGKAEAMGLAPATVQKLLYCMMTADFLFSTG